MEQVNGAVNTLLYGFTGLQSKYPGISRHSSSQLRWQVVVLVYDYLGIFLELCLLLVRQVQFQAQWEYFQEQKARKNILYIKKWRYSGPAIPSWLFLCGASITRYVTAKNCSISGKKKMYTVFSVLENMLLNCLSIMHIIYSCYVSGRMALINTNIKHYKFSAFLNILTCI